MMFLKFQYIAVLTILQCIARAAVITDYLIGKQLLNKRESYTAQDYAVSTLPSLDGIPTEQIPQMFAGYVDIDQSIDEKYFFFRFNKTQASNNNRLIFWYNGGPGCSSMDGALLESGPLFVNQEGKLEYKKGTWLETGDLVYVDQPAGTGFSETEQPDSELNKIADDMLTFFEKYFALFPEDLGKEIYLGGESYAGQYIPYFGARILTQAADKYNLKGLIMINGYIYPDVQNLSIFDYALDNKLITDAQYNSRKVQQMIAACNTTIAQTQEEYASIFKTMEQTGEYESTDGSDSNKVEDDDCSSILEALLDMTLDKSAPTDQQCLNQYDFSLRDSYPACGMNWPVEEPALNTFLNEQSVYADLHLDGSQKWTECADAPYNALVNHNSYPAFFKLPYILSKVKIMLMVGENDLVCNIYGMQDMVNKLTWGSKSTPGYSNGVNWGDLTIADNSTVFGQAKYEDGLWLAKIAGASHMVPYDHAVASRAAIDLFFDDYSLDGTTYVAKSYGDN
ncbi:hypothetical protein DASC09_021910 [Saccharomycopsis crataegensis]|uniref:Carboxypeptidase n=1 Tax=Saccharomycopsis crataegensis TaxID=43959 RepID=A0AAV5QJK4_9ASCO|nr:hypothetical protein DASC09_021910 [Saccharomycopsis crataegensis]